MKKIHVFIDLFHGLVSVDLIWIYTHETRFLDSFFIIYIYTHI